jgi:hypothetical protein
VPFAPLWCSQFPECGVIRSPGCEPVSAACQFGATVKEPSRWEASCPALFLEAQFWSCGPRA